MPYVDGRVKGSRPSVTIATLVLPHHSASVRAKGHIPDEQGLLNPGQKADLSEGSSSIFLSTTACGFTILLVLPQPDDLPLLL